MYHLKHLVLLRHGEGEGDVRRERQRAGEVVELTKPVEEEVLTEAGWIGSAVAGAWLKKHVLAAFGLDKFDDYRVSPAVRCLQTAEALNLLPISDWGVDPCLQERNRGAIRGRSRQQHKEQYPENYERMLADPLHWSPPEGETIVPDVLGRVDEYLDSLKKTETTLAVVHRDWMWAAIGRIAGLSLNELAAFDTDILANNRGLHFTSMNPVTGDDEGKLSWVRLIAPEHGPPKPDLWLPIGSITMLVSTIANSPH